jgi:hypothetical protein
MHQIKSCAASLNCLIQRPHFQAGLVIAVFLATAVLPMAGLGFPTCGFQYLFRLPCPGCGFTRSLIVFTHGHPIQAFRLHWAAPLFSVYLTMILVDRSAKIIRRPSPFPWLERIPVFSWMFYLIFVFWGYQNFIHRNLGSHPSWFAES